MPDERDEFVARFAGLDGPRQLPDDVRARLETMLLDGPRELPVDVRHRLEHNLTAAVPAATPTTRWQRIGANRWVVPAGVAAAVAMLVGSVAVLADRSAPKRSDAVAALATTTTSAVAPASSVVEPLESSSSFSAGATAGSASSGSAPQAQRSATAGQGTPPPFAVRGTPAPSGSSPAPASAPSAAAERDAEFSGGAAPSANAATGAPIPIGLVGTDAAEEGGVRAYVDLLNRTGGINGRPIVLGGASADSFSAIRLGVGGPVDGVPTLLSLQTSDRPCQVADAFCLAGPLDRQAHLLADAVFPSVAQGASAAIYVAASGPFADVVPEAIERVLRERGVRSLRFVHRVGDSVTPGPVDAVFVSLPTAESRSLFATAERAGGFRSARGVAAFSTAHDRSVASMPDGTRLVVPWFEPSGDERSALESVVGAAPSMATIHGWAEAKHLAYALWKSGASDRNQTRTALVQLDGYDSGLAPAMAHRVGRSSKSRTPEGRIEEVRAGAFVGVTEFRRDPHEEAP